MGVEPKLAPSTQRLSRGGHQVILGDRSSWQEALGLSRSPFKSIDGRPVTNVKQLERLLTASVRDDRTGLVQLRYVDWLLP